MRMVGEALTLHRTDFGFPNKLLCILAGYFVLTRPMKKEEESGELGSWGVEAEAKYAAMSCL